MKTLFVRRKLVVLFSLPILGLLVMFSGCGQSGSQSGGAMMEDSMKSDSMMKDGMKSDSMMKDGMKSDGMMKEGMAPSSADMKSEKKM